MFIYLLPYIINILACLYFKQIYIVTDKSKLNAAFF